MKQCDRCHLLSPDYQDDCQHCQDLSDIQLHDFLQERHNQLAEASNLGRTFIVIAIGILILLLFLDQ